MKTQNNSIKVYNKFQLFKLYIKKIGATDESEINNIWTEVTEKHPDDIEACRYLYKLVFNVEDDSEIDSDEEATVDVDSYDFVNDTAKLVLRNIIDSYYAAQKLRISNGNRVCATFAISNNLDEDVKYDVLLKAVRAEYNTITGMITSNTSASKAIKQLLAVGSIKYIKSEIDYNFVKSYEQLYVIEQEISESVSKQVKKHPLWKEFFEKVKGCGPIMAGVCISYFDVNKAKYAYSFCAYAGVDPVKTYKETTLDDGTVFNVEVVEGHCKKHTVDECYVKKDGTIGLKKTLGYNPELQGHLLSVLADSLLRAGYRRDKDKNGVPIEGGKIVAEGYARAYADYMHRLNHRVDTKEYTNAHKHAMCKRYMIKMFLKDLWTVWRSLAGYDIGVPYEVAFLGKDPHHYNRYYEMPKKVYADDSDYDANILNGLE